MCAQARVLNIRCPRRTRIGLRWFRDALGHSEKPVAELLGRDPYDRTIRITLCVEPIPENVARYAECYAVYRSLYPALKPSFDRLGMFQ